MKKIFIVLLLVLALSMPCYATIFNETSNDITVYSKAYNDCPETMKKIYSQTRTDIYIKNDYYKTVVGETTIGTIYSYANGTAHLTDSWSFVCIWKTCPKNHVSLTLMHEAGHLVDYYYDDALFWSDTAYLGGREQFAKDCTAYWSWLLKYNLQFIPDPPPVMPNYSDLSHMSVCGVKAYINNAYGIYILPQSNNINDYIGYVKGIEAGYKNIRAAMSEYQDNYRDIEGIITTFLNVFKR